MNAPLISMTAGERALVEARAVLRRPGEHDRQALHSACAKLLARGDWMDVDRAEKMMRRLAEEQAIRRASAAAAAAEVRRAIEGEDGGWLVTWRDLAGAAALFLLLVASLWTPYALGWLP